MFLGVLHLSIKWQRWGGGKSLGNKGASVCSLCRNLFFPGESAQVTAGGVVLL